MAVTIGATGAVQPALADGEPPPRSGPVVDFVFATFKLIRGGPSAENIQALIQAALAASDRATNEVISHMDAYEAEASRSAAMSAARDFTDFDTIRQDDLGLEIWALNVARSATDVKGRLNVAAWGPAADQMGHAAIDIYPIALTGSKFAGLNGSYNGSTQEYVQVLDKIIRDLAPHCSHTDQPLVDRRQYPLNRVYQCTAADGTMSGQFTEFWGDDGTLQSQAVNLEQLKVNAAVHSSWLAAVRIRPLLGP